MNDASPQSKIVYKIHLSQDGKETIFVTIEEVDQALQAEREWLVSEIEKYNELLLAVETKHEGETRHETALRFIKQYQVVCYQSKEVSLNQPSKE